MKELLDTLAAIGILSAAVFLPALGILFVVYRLLVHDPDGSTQEKFKAILKQPGSVIINMRYTYLGDRLSSLRGIQCDPVLRQNGKCIRSRMGTMLVTDGNKQHIVLARLLRINNRKS